MTRCCCQQQTTAEAQSKLRLTLYKQEYTVRMTHVPLGNRQYKHSLSGQYGHLVDTFRRIIHLIILTTYNKYQTKGVNSSTEPFFNKKVLRKCLHFSIPCNTRFYLPRVSVLLSFQLIRYMKRPLSVALRHNSLRGRNEEQWRGGEEGSSKVKMASRH